MTDIESLRLLTEAVETAGADIAPSYAEYVQLAFAIATDCGEAGREFFHRLCRISAKYQREHAERMFSNALMKQHGEISRRIDRSENLPGGSYEQPKKCRKCTKCTLQFLHTQARVYNIVYAYLVMFVCVCVCACAYVCACVREAPEKVHFCIG